MSFFFELQMIVYHRALIPRKLPCPKKIPAYSPGCPLFTQINFSNTKEALSLLRVYYEYRLSVRMFQLTCFLKFNVFLTN